ncbi:MAG: hypothetical protein N2578_04440 [Bdellovibrionaceae bacterium]|nr:hypothetical protein [Pseudobdellovibrionaceae bacterium]
MIHISRRHVSIPGPRRQNPGVHSIRNFQEKYALGIGLSVLCAGFIFFAPACWFLTENYRLFKILALDTQPLLINNLEREVFWLLGFFVFGLLAIGLSAFVLSWRLIYRLTHPIKSINQHLSSIIEGDFSRPFNSIEQNDWAGLSWNYESFLTHLKKQTREELTLLSKLNVDPRNRDAYQSWRRLVERKSLQLGELPPPVTESAEVSDGSELGRRAS